MILKDLEKMENHPFATNPATIDVPKKTNINVRITRIKMTKIFIHRDLYMLGP